MSLFFEDVLVLLRDSGVSHIIVGGTADAGGLMLRIANVEDRHRD